VKPTARRVLVIGFQPWDQRMYPHLYDVLAALRGVCEVCYFGEDDRGYGLFDIPAVIFSRPRTVGSKLREVGGSLLWAGRRWAAARRLTQLLRNGRFDVVIAIDHQALAAAVATVDRDTRIALWSHDILTPDVDYVRSPLVRRLLNANRRGAERISLLVVQDPVREAVLRSVLGNYTVPAFHLPVALLDDESARRTARQKARRRAPERPRLMQITACARRGSADLLAEWQRFPGAVELHFQGFVSDNMAGPLDRAAVKPVQHPTASSFAEMRATISQVDIGFVSYLRPELNEMLTAHASGQLVEFLRLGIPVIAWGRSTVGPLVEEQHAGVWLHEWSQLKGAVGRIRGDYARFSGGARRCYERRFELQRYVPRLTATLGLTP
jgi:hypothetical protein